MARAIWKGVVLAESDDTEIVEGNHYFPKETVNYKLLEPSDTQYTCPWKGVATYWHLNIDGYKIEDAAWSYENPTKAAQHIKSHLAFNSGRVQISD